MQEKHEVVAYGRTAELLAYGKDQVLKVFRPGIPVETVEEEYRISLSVYCSGVVTPRPFEIINYHDRQGIIYQKASGVTMLQTISQKPWLINKEAARMARLHAEMHIKNVANLPSQKEILKESIAKVQILTDAEKERIICDLKRLKEGNQCCHGDFHPDNIILGDKEWIIDWMTGMTGNPAGDVARTILLLKLGTMPEGAPKLVVCLFTMLRKYMLQKYIFHYIQHSNIRYEEIDDWIVPVAAARLNDWIPEKEKQELVDLIRKRLK